MVLATALLYPLTAAGVDAAKDSALSQPLRPGPKLVGVGELGAAHFGVSAALSADGRTAVVGGAADDHLRGAAWVFSRSGRSWVQLGKLTSGEATRDAFGWSVGISSDGRTALIGAP